MASRSVIPFMFGGSPLARSRGDGDPALSLFRDMDRLFGSVLGLSGAGAGGAGLPVMPRINVSETDNEIRIEAELPGVAPDDVQIELIDDVLTIRGEKQDEREEDEGENYHVIERAYGAFARSIQLPFAVKPDQIQASFRDGVLTIRVPKSAAETQVHRIQLQGGEGARQAGNGGRRSSVDRAAAGDKPSSADKASASAGGAANAGGSTAGQAAGQAAQTNQPAGKS